MRFTLAPLWISSVVLWVIKYIFIIRGVLYIKPESFYITVVVIFWVTKSTSCPNSFLISYYKVVGEKNLSFSIFYWKNSSQKGIDFFEGVTILEQKTLRLLWGGEGRKKGILLHSCFFWILNFPIPSSTIYRCFASLDAFGFWFLYLTVSRQVNWTQYSGYLLLHNTQPPNLAVWNRTLLLYLSSVICRGSYERLALGIFHAIAVKYGWGWSYLKANWGRAPMIVLLRDWQLMLAESSARVVGWTIYMRLLHVYDTGRSSFQAVKATPETGPVSLSCILLVKACVEPAEFQGGAKKRIPSFDGWVFRLGGL